MTATERYQTAVDTAVFADGCIGVLQRNANRAMWEAAALDLGRGRRIVSPALFDFATRIAVRAHDAGLIRLEGQFRHPHTTWPTA